MKEIELTHGLTAMVSDHRFEYLNQWKWLAMKSNKGIYYAARSTPKKNGKREVVFMHHVILPPAKGFLVDHKDLNSLNNQDENLRLCTPSQNKANGSLYSTNKSGFKGVYWSEKRKKWIASLRKDGKHVLQKEFPTAVEAAMAYNDAATKHFGEFARLNTL